MPVASNISYPKISAMEMLYRVKLTRLQLFKFEDEKQMSFEVVFTEILVDALKTNHYHLCLYMKLTVSHMHGI